jgi:GNAT superfamily N-acetyltransferase
MHAYHVRAATPDDWRAIVEFNIRLASESEELRLDADVLTPGVQAALADPVKARYFLACRGEAVVGQLMHTYEWSDWRNGMIWWLQSVYVLTEHRGQGVFRRLFEHLHALAQTDPGVVGLRLYVENENHRAKEVYSRLGLAPGGYQVMEHFWRNAPQPI